MARVLDFIQFSVVFGFFVGPLAECATRHTSEQS